MPRIWRTSCFNRSFLDPSVLGTFPSELIDLLKEQDALPLMGGTGSTEDREPHGRPARHQLLSAETDQGEGTPPEPEGTVHAGAPVRLL